MEKKKDSRKIYICWFFIKAILTIAALYALTHFIFSFAIVRGDGMAPKAMDGDVVIAYRLSAPERDELTVLERDGTKSVLRVIAKGGDTVDVTDRGVVTVNGLGLTDNVWSEASAENAQITLPCKVAEGDVFLLGDNHETAVDSMAFGPVHEQSLEGTVITLLRKRGF